MIQILLHSHMISIHHYCECFFFQNTRSIHFIDSLIFSLQSAHWLKSSIFLRCWSTFKMLWSKVCHQRIWCRFSSSFQMLFLSKYRLSFYQLALLWQPIKFEFFSPEDFRKFFPISEIDAAAIVTNAYVVDFSQFFKCISSSISCPTLFLRRKPTALENTV